MDDFGFFDLVKDGGVFEKQQPKKTKRPKVAAKIDVTSDLLNVLPKQFEQIKELRVEYYKHLDSILCHYHVTPVLVWVLRAAQEIIDDITSIPEPATEPNAPLIRQMMRKLDTLMQSGNKPTAANAANANETDDTDALRLRAIRRDLNQLPDEDKWIQTIDAIDAILHIRVPGSYGTYYTRREQPNPESLERAITLDELQMLKHMTDQLLVLDPSDEWTLMNALDVSLAAAADAAKSKSKSNSRNKSITDEEKNRLQTEAYTLSGMKKIVDNARAEADKHNKLARALMVKLLQSVELVASLVETKQAAPIYLTVLNAYVDYAAPHISRRRGKSAF